MIPQLCFVTDAEAALSIPEQAERAARGGAGWVQLRHKTLNDGAFADLARELHARLTPLGVALILNDRVEIARELKAFGVHIGQSDGDPHKIRCQLGPGAILGLSIENANQLSDIPPACVSYLGVGPVRATATKPDHAAPLGFDGLAEIADATGLPCMAIGGLSAKDVPGIRDAGCDGIAVVSAISRATDPERAARSIVDQWRDT